MLFTRSRSKTRLHLHLLHCHTQKRYRLVTFLFMRVLLQLGPTVLVPLHVKALQLTLIYKRIFFLSACAHATNRQHLPTWPCGRTDPRQIILGEPPVLLGTYSHLRGLYSTEERTSVLHIHDIFFVLDYSNSRLSRWLTIPTGNRVQESP